MKKFKCTLCSYIYEPTKGDIEGGIPENTSFNELPEDWTCPICRNSKDKFEEIEIKEECTIKSDSLEEQQIAPKNDTRFEGTINNDNYDNNIC